MVVFVTCAMDLLCGLFGFFVIVTLYLVCCLCAWCACFDGCLYIIVGLICWVGLLWLRLLWCLLPDELCV